MNLRSISVDIPPVCDQPEASAAESSPTIPLRRREQAARGFAAVLGHLDNTILRQWEATIDDTDPEAVHDLRVAMRRSRSVLRAARDVFADETLDRFEEDLRWLAGLTGPTRDLDVFIAEWHRYVDGLGKRTVAALLPVSEHLRRHRRAAFEAMVEGMESERAQQLLTSWTDELTGIRDGRQPVGRLGDRRLGRVVGRRITKAHKRLITHGRAITDTSPVEALHDLRKDAKRLRYVTECFGGMLPKKATKHFARRLKALQDNLGTIQDGHVHAAQLRLIAGEFERENASPATLVAVGRLSERLDATTAEARAEFGQRFADFDSKRTRRVLVRVIGNI